MLSQLSNGKPTSVFLGIDVTAVTTTCSNWENVDVFFQTFEFYGISLSQKIDVLVLCESNCLKIQYSVCVCHALISNVVRDKIPELIPK